MDKLFDHPWRLVRVERREDVIEVALARPEASSSVRSRSPSG